MNQTLDNIKNPQDLKKLTEKQKQLLCQEIRERMIGTVSRTGGHLASNLGIVELTVALHSVFDCPKDTFIFDVGHQCYVHKILTGRNAEFDSLRQKDGISGFPKPSESVYDSFIEGHASTSISQAIGLAQAKKLSGDNSKTIAVIGDGSLTGGLAFEAMNNIDQSLDNLIIILNDNSMSISKSVGTISNYLMRLRTSSNYLTAKKNIKETLGKIPLVGSSITDFITTSKAAIRRSLFGGIIFEELGFNYVGPIDGHDLSELELFFSHLRDSSDNGPVFVHVITKKGKGYVLAEQNPGAYHGVGKFDLDRGNPDISLVDSFSNTFGRTLADLSSKDDNICTVTAAMKYATGLQYFSHLHPDRFFDVGIAEQHAVTMCSGLSKGGKNPVFAVYSTFLQRAVDQLYQDISLDDINILLAIDRAGLVGDDGETHQGLFDVAILSALDVFKIVSPCNYSELIYWLNRLISEKGARAIRYPRGKENADLSDYKCTGNDFDLIKTDNENRLLLVTYGREFSQVRAAAKLLNLQGISTDILKLNVVYPISKEVIAEIQKYEYVLFAEEGIKKGGIAEQMALLLLENGYKGRYETIAIDNHIVRQGSVEEQIKLLGLDRDSLIDASKELFNEKTN